MMNLHQLYERAYKQGIEIDEVHMMELRAVSFAEGWIAMDPRKYESERAFKCDLAHEIGHCETGSFYNVYSGYDLMSKCERKANRRAAQMLMPFGEVLRAIHAGYDTPWALAEYFDTTEEFAQMAVGIYESDLRDALKGGMQHARQRTALQMQLG